MDFYFAIFRNIVSICFVWFYSAICLDYIAHAGATLSLPFMTIILTKHHVLWFSIPLGFIITRFCLKKKLVLNDKIDLVMKNSIETVSLVLILLSIAAWRVPFFYLK